MDKKCIINLMGEINMSGKVQNLVEEVKALVDGAPKAIKEKVSQAEADEIKAKLEEAGATVEVK